MTDNLDLIVRVGALVNLRGLNVDLGQALTEAGDERLVAALEAASDVLLDDIAVAWLAQQAALQRLRDIVGGDPARTLAQSGVAGVDIDTALAATRRCQSITGWSVEDAAEFVATAAAIGGITGPALLLVPNLARIAVRAGSRP